MGLGERVRNSVFKKMVNGDLSVEGAVIIWRNFIGAPTKFNAAGGKRTFALVLNEEIADELQADGWNVKRREPIDPDGDYLIYTEIVVNMDSAYPPKVVLFSEFRGQKSSRNLDADTIGELDTVNIANIDLIIHPYEHGRAVASRVKGYAKVIHVIQDQDRYFDGKYDDWETE